MTTIVNDPDVARDLIRQRRRLGQDKFDEVWNGRYIINAMPNNKHSEIVGELTVALRITLGRPARILPGTNISDQPVRWKSNYRCPDLAVFLPGNTAEDRHTHWLGGPDFAVEVLSPRDRARKKLNFYAAVGTRELLLIDRQPWQLELYRLVDGQLVLAAKSGIDGDTVRCETVGLALSLHSRETTPELRITAAEISQEWSV